MTLSPGKNIAIKVPAYKWAETVAFYRDRVGLPFRSQSPDTVAFGFGTVVLWIDRVPAQSQTDVWLELISDDPGAAVRQLQGPVRDELEPLGKIEGHWTSDPAGVVLLVRKD